MQTCGRGVCLFMSKKEGRDSFGHEMVHCVFSKVHHGPGTQRTYSASRKKQTCLLVTPEGPMCDYICWNLMNWDRNRVGILQEVTFFMRKLNKAVFMFCTKDKIN